MTNLTLKSSGLDELDLLEEKRARRKARQSLLSFCQYTKADYQPAWHLEQLAAKLEAVERGECKRLIVTMPPQHGKSELISLRFPCWYLGRHPEALIVQAGYAESIALLHSRQARDIFTSPEGKVLFPERGGHDIIERQAAHEWGTKQGGSYYAVGVGGGLTGRGFNLGIIDDPVKDAEEAASQLIREKVCEWYRTVFRTRVHPDAAIIVVMTRWNVSDLVGWLLKLATEDPTADKWEILHLPAISKDGAALWPERYPIEVIQNIRATVGSRAFEALYQGNPTIAEGNIIKREWWKYYKERPHFTRIVQSWDTAFKAKAENDYSVCTVWGEAANGYYLLDVWRQKVEYPELKRAAISLHGRDKANAVLVEDKASGQSLIQELKRETALPVLPVKVDSDKIARVNAVSPLIEAGKVFIPEYATWLHDYIEELSAFPNGANDDAVDSTTQFLAWVNKRPYLGFNEDFEPVDNSTS